MHRLGDLAQRMFNTPLAIHPQKAEIIMAALADRLGISNAMYLDGRNIKMSNDFGEDEDERKSNNPRSGYDVVEGVAIIQIRGTLVQRCGSLRPYSGMTGYNAIRQNLLLAMDDSRVKGILLDIDSPGGEVSGCFDLADAIYEMRGIKPMHSVLSDKAYSAAYAIASATDKITIPRTGGVGSVGVVTMHIDWSKAIGEAGMKVTFITYGDRKAEGNQFEPLSKETLGHIQSDITKIGELFVETVSRNRNLSSAKIRATEAACYMGADGVAIGLADAVMPPDAAFRALLKELAA